MMKLFRYPIATFFAGCFLFSWSFWAIRERLFLPEFLFYFGPFVSALIVTASVQGRPGLHTLLTPIFIWRVGFRWYLFIFLLPPVGAIGVVALIAWHANIQPQLPPESYWWNDFPKHVALMMLFALSLTLFTAGEELGWRGYALPKLQQHYHPLIASIIIGFFLGVWHLPTLLNPARGLDKWDIVIFIGLTMSVSVVYTWLYNNTHGSLLITSLFHSIYNSTVGYVSALVSFESHNTKGYDLFVSIVVVLMIIGLAGARLGYASLRTDEIAP